VATDAVFHALFGVDEQPSAVFSQHIERTEAEQAVKALPVGLGVTGKVLTILIGEEPVAGFDCWHLHASKARALRLHRAAH